MPVAAYYLHDPAAPKPNSPTRMGTNVLLECRGRLLLEQRWDCGAWGLPGGRLRRGEDEAHGIARELFEETGLRLPEAAFTRVRVLDDADRIASYQDGTVWRMVIVLFRAQLPQEPELHCSRESCTLRFFTPEELRTADLVPTHRDLIEAWRPAPLEVAAAMLTRGQTVLLCRRPEGKARALQWEFPGGKLEPGETGEQALARECREELGAEVRVGPRVDELVFDYPDENFFDASEKHVQNTIMMAQAGGEPMQSAFSYPELEKLLETHGFLIYELLTPDDIQRDIIDKAGADLKAFEHVNYCLAIKKD